MWQVKTTVEYVVGQNEVSAKPAIPGKKESTNPVLMWEFPDALDQTSGHALCALHYVYVSP